MHFLGEEYARVGEQQKARCGDERQSGDIRSSPSATTRLRVPGEIEAAQCFSRGLELEPNHLPSLMELGQLACAQMVQGERKRATQVSPASGRYRQSNWHEAERLFTRICEWLGLSWAPCSCHCSKSVPMPNRCFLAHGPTTIQTPLGDAETRGGEPRGGAAGGRKGVN